MKKLLFVAILTILNLCGGVFEETQNWAVLFRGRSHRFKLLRRGKNRRLNDGLLGHGGRRFRWFWSRRRSHENSVRPDLSDDRRRCCWVFVDWHLEVRLREDGSKLCRQESEKEEEEEAVLASCARCRQWKRRWFVLSLCFQYKCTFQFSHLPKSQKTNKKKVFFF